MCGRYTLEHDPDFYERFDLTEKVPFKSSFNVSPSQINPVIVRHSPNSMVFLSWGLVPFWEEGKDSPHTLINVRAESILEKPWGHKYLEENRCLVPASGFFEWQKTKTGKIPHYIHPKRSKFLSFAGVYGGDTYTILTTTPNTLMSPIHSRMPVILSEDEEQIWLDPSIKNKDRLKSLLKPGPPGELSEYVVSSLVNNPENNSPATIEPAV